jgi:hypothetical protein
MLMFYTLGRVVSSLGIVVRTLDYVHIFLGYIFLKINLQDFFRTELLICFNSEHLSVKEVSLFCFVVMRSTEWGCFRSCSWCLWKALDEEGCMGLVP